MPLTASSKLFRILGPAAVAAVVTGVIFLANALGSTNPGSASAWLNQPVKVPMAASVRAAAASCAAKNLSVRLTRHGIVQGGTYAYVYDARNTSGKACYISGYPQITLAGKAVAHGPDILDVAAGTLSPGQAAMFALTQTVTPGCSAGATDNGIMKQTTKPALMSIGAHQSRAIGKVLVNKCTKNSVTALGLAPVEPKPDTLSVLSVRLEVPATATAGQTLNFRVVLTNPTRARVWLSPCPGYEVGISTAGEHAYRLNCVNSLIAPGQSRVFDMQYAIPASTRAGLAKIGWLLLNPQRTGSGTVINIVD
jgi:hypothetical protein